MYFVRRYKEEPELQMFKLPMTFGTQGLPFWTVQRTVPITSCYDLSEGKIHHPCHLAA